MRKIFLLLMTCAMGHVLSAQAGYKLRYWFDGNYSSRNEVVSSNGNWHLMMNTDAVSIGIHTLYLQTQNDTGRWESPRSFLFFRTATSDELIGNDSFSYWFDEDDGNSRFEQSGMSSLQLETENLSVGLHQLYIRVGNSLTSQVQGFLFLKLPQLDSSYNEYTYWFDEDYSNHVSGEIGDGQLLINTESLDTGSHTLYVRLAKESYSQINGYSFTVTPIVYDVAITSSDTTMGHVSKNGSHGRLDTVSLEAIPHHGYHFSVWSDGDTLNPRQIVLSHDTSIIAYFEPNMYHLSAYVDSLRGSVEGAGDYSYLSSAEVYVSSNYGYHFSSWADGNSDNPRSIVVEKDTLMAAIVVPNQYNVSVESSNVTMGNVMGAGVYDYLTPLQIEAVAVPGYRFVHWSDGDTANPRNLVVMCDSMFEAQFDFQLFTLSVRASNTSMGMVIGGGNFRVIDTATITAITYSGCTFEGWSDGVRDNPRQLNLHSDSIIVAMYSMYSNDTAFVELHIHDTTYIDVPYAVHDTSYVDVYIHDTTIVTDTVTLTEYVPVHDTTYIDVHDTTYIDVPYAVHDTTYIDVHDTTYIDVPYAVHDTSYVDVYIHDTTIVTDTVTLTEYVPVHDTTYITLTDTVTNTLFDTITNTIYDTIDNYIHDTTTVLQTDTLWFYDTIYIHDTIYIYDTVYVGVDEVDVINTKIYTSRQQIVVEGADGNTVWLYDVNGRMLATRRDEYAPLRFDVPVSGTYLIKIGDLPARRVVVIR